MVTMDWKSGPTLGEWVADRVRRGDTRVLAALADRLGVLLADLKRHQIAHGDLQHGNILVIDDDLVLVDYDGMCVPSLVGQPRDEFGLDGYQHPLRKHQPLTLAMDDFAAWIIWLSLRAVAVDPRLWEKYSGTGEDPRLLFKPRDITRFDDSPVWHELMRLPEGRPQTQLPGLLRRELRPEVARLINRARALDASQPVLGRWRVNRALSSRWAVASRPAS
jgi:hypothetical protein